jgi:hypothetical protein
VLARECPSPYSLASWQLHHTERCWCSTPAAACTERRALRCHWVGTARCRCVPALADDHATPCWLLQPHASNESSASRPAACPPPTGTTDEGTEPIPGRARRSKRTPHASRPHRAARPRATPREREPARPAAWRPTRARMLIAGRAHSPVPIATKAPAGRGWFVRW